MFMHKLASRISTIPVHGADGDSAASVQTPLKIYKKQPYSATVWLVYIVLSILYKWHCDALQC